VITLAATRRDVYGKALAKSRTEGLLPVVVYGRKEQSASYFVALPDFKKVYREAGESSVISLKTPEGALDVLIHETGKDPITGEFIHADFYAVEKGKALRVSAPIVWVGEAPAIKLGGIVVKVLHELEVEALPQDLPHEISVDLAGLETLESQISVKDLAIPAQVKIIAEPDDIVAAVAVAKEEEEAPVMDISQIEVEKRGKQEEEGAGTPEQGDQTSSP